MLGKWFTTEVYLSLEKWSHHVAQVGLELIVYVAHSPCGSQTVSPPVLGSQYLEGSCACHYTTNAMYQYLELWSVSVFKIVVF